jgi:hypothetical protein
MEWKRFKHEVLTNVLGLVNQDHLITLLIDNNIKQNIKQR